MSQVSGSEETPTESEGLNLGELWQAVRRRRRLALLVGTIVAASAFGSTLWERTFSPIYQGSFQLLISDPISTGGVAAAEGGAVETLARNRTSIDFPSLVETLRSPMVLDPLRRQLGPAGGLLGAAQVSQVADGVLSVSLSGSKPSEIQAALDSLSAAYLNFAIDQRQRQLNEGLKFLDEQEPKLQFTVNQLQGQLAAFRRRYNLLDPETEAGALKTESSGFDGLERELDAERSRLEKLRQGVMAGTLTSSGFSTVSDSGVTVTQANGDLLAQLQGVEEQLSLARSTYRSDTPRMQSLTALRTRLAGQLRSNQLEALDTALRLNAARASTIAGQRRQVDRRFLKQPALIKDYEQIQQRLTVAQENLTNFLTTRSTFQLERAQKSVPWTLLSSPAVDGNPVSPKLKQGLTKAILFGLIAGMGAAILRDRFDHVFRRSVEVRDQLKVPLLGHIPHLPFFKDVKQSGRFQVDELDRDSVSLGSSTGPYLAGSTPAAQVYQRFAYKEAFRNLYTSLRFLNTDQNLLTVGLTSSTPSEGKSLVNVLLAKTISEMGQRVLLIDCDMRKPQVHHRLGLNNLNGLSNLLTEDYHWRELLLPVKGYDNWWVIPAGLRPPDPTRLLSSSRMKELLQQISQSGQFDLILFDTPPVLGMADTALLAQHLDGLILLVSLDGVDRNLPKESLARISSTGAPLLGLVTNAMKEELKSPNETLYQRYGYAEADGASDQANAPATTTFDWPLRPQLLQLRKQGTSLLRWIDG
ncbi:polysaccharide biosynthesis tyrosine autokinase [Cyanobium sp. BA20m-p-22]|uniref:GumC family protein n=1 Tax=Cyanobium sp. BA20m-p-22 TaxID=2823704 RepID=UPI0020CD63B6|nr:tyrosine-protein kinase [Cyanobium sp. BA20m-p-22]MCP9909351.1 polysaccharide biosynthesis tyrosine autokinase [Cyanobium sp. BA20m-p-22]